MTMIKTQGWQLQKYLEIHLNKKASIFLESVFFNVSFYVSFVCMYVYIHVPLCVCECACVCVCTGSHVCRLVEARGQLHVSSLVFTLFSEIGSLSILKLTD